MLQGVELVPPIKLTPHEMSIVLVALSSSIDYQMARGHAPLGRAMRVLREKLETYVIATAIPDEQPDKDFTVSRNSE